MYSCRQKAGLADMQLVEQEAVPVRAGAKSLACAVHSAPHYSGRRRRQRHHAHVQGALCVRHIRGIQSPLCQGLQHPSALCWNLDCRCVPDMNVNLRFPQTARRGARPKLRQLCGAAWRSTRNAMGGIKNCSVVGKHMKLTAPPSGACRGGRFRTQRVHQATYFHAVRRQAPAKPNTDCL